MPLLPLHQAHNYRALMARWRALAAKLKLKLQTLTVVQGVKVHWLETGIGDDPVIYLSSGVHGDEAGAAWGLLTWAEENVSRLRQQRFLIFPCLNPFGLMLNTRADHQGRDINRRFHVDEDDICGPWRRLMLGRAIRLGFCLHEDYDGQGCYVYELSHSRVPLSLSIMAGLRSLPPDPRKNIDGSRAQLGVIRRKRVPNLPGLPEAIVLHQFGCRMTFTFETPSEFNLDDRIQAQVEFVNAVLSAMDIPE
jgi:protein MpaA